MAILSAILLICLPAAYFLLIPDKPIRGWALFSLIVVELVAVPFVARYYRLKPAVILNRDGIQDFRLDYGLIPWDNVASVYLQKLNMRPILCLVLKDPKAVPHPVLRTINKLMGTGHVSIELGLLKP